jgi:hypothetical protein
MALIGRQRFTALGGIGAALFIAGPVGSILLSGRFLADLQSSDSYGGVIGLTACSFAFLIGAILMLIGREMVFLEADEVSSAPSSEPRPAKSKFAEMVEAKQNARQ